MKSFIPVLVFLSAHSAWSVTRVSVTRFDEENSQVIANCKGFVFSGQRQLQTQLERALVTRGIRMVERRGLRQMQMDEGVRNYSKADYTITGAVTELGVCEESESNSVQVGGLLGWIGGPSGVDLEVDKSGALSRITLVAQVVSVRSSEILQSFTATAELNDEASRVRAGYAGVGGSHRAKTNLPIERAAHAAIEDLATQITQYLASK